MKVTCLEPSRIVCDSLSLQNGYFCGLEIHTALDSSYSSNVVGSDVEIRNKHEILETGMLHVPLYLRTISYLDDEQAVPFHDGATDSAPRSTV